MVDPDVCDSEAFEHLDSLHGSPSLVRFSLTRGLDSCADSEGPIDVIDVETKGLIRLCIATVWYFQLWRNLRTWCTSALVTHRCLS